MFYPIQSARYTLRITRALWLAANKRLSVGAYLLLMLGIGVFIWISWSFSFSFGIVCALLAWISIIDLYDRIIPDILLVGVCLALLWAYPIPHLIMPFLVILMVFLMKIWLEKIYKKPLIGWGDIKLIALCVTFIPISLVPTFFMLCGGGSLVTAIIFRKPYLPFGPFIAISFSYIISGSF